MTIRINQIAVDFTLEKERTFADLTVALRAWALGQDLALLGILADGRALGPEDTTPLESIGTIEVEAVPAGERDLARAAVLARYFSLLSQAFGSEDRDLRAELQAEYPGVRAALFPLLDPFAPRLKAALEALDGSWSTPDVLVASAALVAEAAEDRRHELQSPVQALAETLDRLDRCLDNLADLGLLFQKGEDRSAFDRILELFTVLGDLGRRVLFGPQEEGARSDWTAFVADLQPFLREAESALSAGDYILLTDLLEYEVCPRLREVRDRLPAVPNLDPVTGVL
jgi:hypothetical protein